MIVIITLKIKLYLKKTKWQNELSILRLLEFPRSDYYYWIEPFDSVFVSCVDTNHMPALFYAIASSIMVSLKFDDIRKLEQRFSNAKEIKTETLGPELRVEALKNFENVISQLHAKAALDPALLEHLLQFGTVFRRSMDTELLTHVSGVFRALEFEVKQGEVVGLSPKLNWIIFEGLRRCITFKEFQELKGSFLWSDEKQKIDSFLQNSREVTKEEVVAFFKDYKKKFTIFFSASEVSHLFKEDIEKLWRFASRGNKAQRSIASRALFYLVEENDVVPDHIGLFGMVDDLEVLRLSMNQLEPSNLSERILSEVSGIDNSLHSLLIERTSAQFLGTSPLFAMSKSMKLLIGATRFLMGANKNRIHLVLPDKGLATLPLLCSFLLDYRFSEKQSPEWLEENGKEIFFNMKNLSVAVKYLGPAFSSGERIQGRVKIGTSGKRTKESFWTTIPQQALEFATLEPRYPDNISGNVKLISQWLLRDNAFVPPHIHFTNKLEKHFCVLTRKANFQSIISDFKPFGIQLRELVNFHYFKTIEASELIHNRRLPGNAPDVDVFSNAGVLAERLHQLTSAVSEVENEIILFIDEESLALEFLGLLPLQSPLYKKVYIIILSDSAKGWFRKECDDLGFETFALHGHIQNLVEKSNRQQKPEFDDVLSSYERKLERSLSAPKWEPIEVHIEAMDEYMRLLREISRKIRIDDLPVSQSSLFKFSRLQRSLSQCWLPRTSAQLKSIEEQFLEVKQALDYDLQLIPEISQLVRVLSERKHELFIVPEKRGILNFLEKNKDQNFYLIEEHETDARRARDYVAKESIENVEILSVANLRGRYLNRPVLVPFLFSNSVIDVLSSASIASELKLFFSNFEIEVFSQRKKRTDRATQRLQVATKKSFEGTFLEEMFTRIVPVSEKTSELEVEADDNIRAILKTYARKFSVSDTRDVSEAIPIFIRGGSQMILFPPGTNIITIDEEGSFGDRKANQFLPGRKIFIRMGASGDFLDEAAKHTNPRYNEIKNTATIWKAELQDLLSNRFGGDYAKLTKYLKGYGVVREEVTVKNWLNDMSLIAPRAHSDTLQKFAQMHVSLAMKESIQKIIEAVYLTYEMRREASEIILRELNSQINIEGAETTVTLRFGNELLDFSVETIEALGAQITTSVGNLGVVQDVH